jgi:hypothetical protein
MSVILRELEVSADQEPAPVDTDTTIADLLDKFEPFQPRSSVLSGPGDDFDVNSYTSRLKQHIAKKQQPQVDTSTASRKRSIHETDTPEAPFPARQRSDTRRSFETDLVRSETRLASQISLPFSPRTRPGQIARRPTIPPAKDFPRRTDTTSQSFRTPDLPRLLRTPGRQLASSLNLRPLTTPYPHTASQQSGRIHISSDEDSDHSRDTIRLETEDPPVTHDNTAQDDIQDNATLDKPAKVPTRGKPKKSRAKKERRVTELSKCVAITDELGVTKIEPINKLPAHVAASLEDRLKRLCDDNIVIASRITAPENHDKYIRSDTCMAQHIYSKGKSNSVSEPSSGCRTCGKFNRPCVKIERHPVSNQVVFVFYPRNATYAPRGKTYRDVEYW